MYPRLYAQNIAPRDFYAGYIQTYLERDLRLLKNVHDLSAFHVFLKMCAHRTGQLLNLSSLASDCGITHNTAKAWISLLETSLIIFLLRPHHQNFNKRLVKMPKLYFTDPGLASHLADIQDSRQMRSHPLKGPLFESLMITERMKYRFNLGRESHVYFWRDKSGHEIDCLLDLGSSLVPIEVKSGMTVTKDYFKNLTFWNKISRNAPQNSFIIYGGTEHQQRSLGRVLSWKNAGLLDELG